MKFGFTNSQESKSSNEGKLGFVPAMFANKNKASNDEGGPNTITKMFKNAPPPRAKPKRTVDDISNAEEVLTKNESS